MNNPWLEYDYKANNKVHPLDAELFEKVNRRLAKRGEEFLLSDKNVALPYFGNPNANLFLLYANPGLDRTNTVREETPELSRLFDAARRHELLEDQAFVFLRSEFMGTPGYQWWERTLRFVFRRYESPHARKMALSNMFSAEIHPYKSVKYGPLTKKEGYFPTSNYTFEIVDQAVKRGALILVARGKSEWFRAVPSLAKYDKVIYLSSAQQSVISPNNVIDYSRGFEAEQAKNYAWQLITKEALRQEPGRPVQLPF